MITKKGRAKKLPYFILLLFVFGLFPIVSADGDTFKQWSDVDIRHPIRVDGAISTAIDANITVKDPEGSVIVAFQPMSTDGIAQEHNYTVLGGSTGLLGIYTYTVTASDGNLQETRDYTFQITPSGQEGLLGYYFLIILLAYGLLIFGIYKQDITISLFGTMSLYFVGLWVLLNGLDIFKNFLTDAFAFITLGVAAYTSISIASEYWTA